MKTSAKYYGLAVGS